MKRLRGKLTYANVMVTILAFVVLCGGAAVAAVELGRNTVGTKQLKRGAVTSAKVKDRSLLPKDFAKAFGAPIGRPSPPGPAGPQGPPGPPGTSIGYQAQGDSDSLGASLFGTQVVSLAVPPGSYFAIATVEANTADGFAGGVNCRLINGVGGAGSTATGRFQTLQAGAVENMTLTSAFKVSAGQSLNLQCNREGPSTLVRAVQANIVAVQISDVSGFAG